MFADVTSANVVGYNTVDLGLAYTMIGPNFGNVGKTGLGRVYLEDIKGNFVDNDQIQISKMVNGKIDFTVYTYFTEDGYMEVDKDGWYLDSDTYVGDTIYLDQGHAAWLRSASSSTQSGEVNGTEITLNNLTKTYEMMVDPYPVAFNPNSSDITWNGVVDNDQIQVSKMVNGKIDFTVYTYFTEDGYMEVDKDGWYIDSDTPVESPIAAAGQGWWLRTANPASVSITFKSPIK